PYPLESLLDRGRDLVPGSGLGILGANVVAARIEVEAGEVGAPGRHGLLAEGAEGAQTVLPHPFGLAFPLGDGVHDPLVETRARPEDRLVRKVVAVRVFRYFKLGRRRLHRLPPRSRTAP